MSPVDELRSAAALLRQLAEAATPGPWTYDDRQRALVGANGATVAYDDVSDQPVADTSYLAAVHPLVGQAMAGLLEHMADDMDDDRAEEAQIQGGPKAVRSGFPTEELALGLDRCSRAGPADPRWWLVSDRDSYLRHLLAELRDSVYRSEESEATYRTRVDQHIAQAATIRGRSKVDAEVRASTDSIVRGAASDGAFYRDRAKTYALAFLAEVFSVKIEEPT